MRFASLPVGKIFLLASICASWTAQISHAGLIKGDVIKLDRSGGATGGASGGGEFTISKLISTSGPDVWESLGVQTFCVEFNEHISLGEKLWVGGISDRAVLGGISGQDVSGGDPLDPRTQLLYQSFITNNLASTGFLDGSNAWSNGLQRAIWYLEGEVTSLVTTESQALYNSVSGYTGGALNSVFVLNLFSFSAPKTAIDAFDPNNSSTWGALNSFRRQDQLFYQLPPPPPPHMPEPNSGVLWLTGLCTIACCIRMRAFANPLLYRSECTSLV